MTRRLVIGKRGAEAGLWLSKPGVNALTATGSNLLLSISTAAEQLIMFGTLSVLPATVPLGLSQSPFVFLTTRAPQRIDPDYFIIEENSYWRPFPLESFENHNAQVSISPASMTVSGGGSQARFYMVFRRKL